jgi:iron complex outermembrane receptor protein
MESYLELYQPVSGVNGLAVRTLGNQDLVPERVFTVEAGLHDESSNLHSADVTVYMNQVRDLVGLTDVDGTQFSDVLPEQQVIAAGTTTFTNVEGLYRGVGAELDGRLYPLQGVDLYGNIAVGQVLLDAGGEVTPDRSMSSVKVNAGVLLRTPWRTDVATHVNYLSGQTWSERDVDEQGKLEINDLPIPGRTVLVARVATRPFADEELELAVTGWNLLALAEGGSFQEHPLGQYVGPRWFGSATWRF